MIVPAYRGELDILPGHAPLVTTLTPGILKYKLKGSNKFTKAALSWGYLEVTHKGVNILAETAEVAEDIDLERAKVALEKAQEKLKSGLALAEVEKYQRKVNRARVRLELKKNHS